MKRLAAEGTLALAGPLDGVDGRCRLFVLAVLDIESTKTITAADPVIIEGEMSAEYHTWCGSAAVMMIRELHDSVATWRSRASKRCRNARTARAAHSWCSQPAALLRGN